MQYNIRNKCASYNLVLLRFGTVYEQRNYAFQQFLINELFDENEIIFN